VPAHFIEGYFQRYTKEIPNSHYGRREVGLPLDTFRVYGTKEGWECQWCGLSFKPRHATRAMRHVLKLKGGDIAICKAVISARNQDRYQASYDRQFTRVDSKRKSDEILRDSVTEQQEAAVQSLLDKCKQYVVSVNRLAVFLLPMLHLLQVELRGVHLPLLCRVNGQRQQCISRTFRVALMPQWKWQSRTSFIARISPMQWWNHLDSSD